MKRAESYTGLCEEKESARERKRKVQEGKKEGGIKENYVLDECGCFFHFWRKMEYARKKIRGEREQE